MTSEGVLYFFVTGEIADVITMAGHRPGIDLGLGAKPGNEATRGIRATTALNAFLDEMAVVPSVIIEGWHAPVALGLGGLLLHGKKLVIIGYLGNATLMELGFVGLVIAHDTGGVLRLAILDEVLQAEVQEVVSGHDQEVVVQLQLLDSKEDIFHCTQAGLVRGGTIVEDGNLVGTLRSPVLEDMGELMVADDDIFVYLAGLGHIVDEPVQDGFACHLQKGLGEVLGQRIEAGGISCCQYQTLHIFAKYLKIYTIGTVADIDLVFAGHLGEGFQVFFCDLTGDGFLKGWIN